MLLILILFFGFSQVAYSDIPLDDAMKTYKVLFSDWVTVLLHVKIAVSTEDYYVKTYPKIINNKVKFVVTGKAANTSLGRKWYKEFGLKIEEDIALMCEQWKAQGYSISLNDFEINIEARGGQ